MARRSILSGGLGGLLAGIFRTSGTKAEEPAAPGMITIDDPRFERFLAARSKLWATIGTVDDDVITYIVSPEFQGAPAWPTTRQAFQVVRPAGSLIVASDGLSDLFVDSGVPGPGFECEVYLESPDLADADFETIRASWQFSLIESFARNVANWGGIDDQLEKYGIISMELPAPPNMPQRWITDRGQVGALIDVKVPDRPTTCQLDEGVEIRLIALTLLLPDETAHVVAGRAEARQELAAKLVAAGTGLTSPANRRSVLA